jgi:hypothetical protein
LAYKHTNSQGVTYYLHSTRVTLRGGEPQTIYFFAKVPRDAKGVPVDLPPDRLVKENPRSGFLTISKTKGPRPPDQAPDPPFATGDIAADPSRGEGRLTPFGLTSGPAGDDFFLERWANISASALSLPAHVLREAISDRGVTERDLQEILERHPELIPGDYFEARPQIILEPNIRGQQIPDFMLRPVDDLWDLLEIKTAAIRVVVNQRSRPRFSQAMASAIQQVRDYAQLLESEDVRDRLAQRYGIRTFKPRMILIAGRSRDASPVEYRRIATQAASDVQFYSWDDVLNINLRRGRLS